MHNPQEEFSDPAIPVTTFQNSFVGQMDLYADSLTVTNYLDLHKGWFCRCAHPFQADPIGDTGYAIGIGKVAAFGFRVDPRVGLNLLPQDRGVYRIVTIPIPEQEPQGYEVDFQAEMKLQEDSCMTRVEWTLLLTVSLQFPRFIHRIPAETIQKMGDAILSMVVKRVSHSLTSKVQNDFHQTHGITIPR